MESGHLQDFRGYVLEQHIYDQTKCPYLREGSLFQGWPFMRCSFLDCIYSNVNHSLKNHKISCGHHNGQSISNFKVAWEHLVVFQVNGWTSYSYSTCDCHIRGARDSKKFTIHHMPIGHCKETNQLKQCWAPVQAKHQKDL